MPLAVGVDPGLRHSGLAFADVKSGQVLHGSLVDSPQQEGEDDAEAWRAMGEAVAGRVADVLLSDGVGSHIVDLLVVERMVIRGDVKRNKLLTRNPGQILTLAAITGVVIGAVPADRVAAVYTASWKPSGENPQQTADRIWGELSRRERELCGGAEKKSTGHNIMAAVGMAQWGASRFRLRLL